MGRNKGPMLTIFAVDTRQVWGDNKEQVRVQWQGKGNCCRFEETDEEEDASVLAGSKAPLLNLETWMIDNMNVSAELMMIKNKCISKHYNDEKMKPIECLASGSIFFFSKRKSSSITSFMKHADHTRLTKYINFKKNQYKPPALVDA
ncbi:hypothetical protein EDC96DRAFT_546943 [Choanephora cucurbitarum]|nr:hypothetical protein EDC96DRAFT_546943 [Choanephora cucurbitarum]